jgi:hypothetical protein
MCQAPDFSPGERVFKPAETPRHKLRALALVAARPQLRTAYFETNWRQSQYSFCVIPNYSELIR